MFSIILGEVKLHKEGLASKPAGSLFSQVVIEHLYYQLWPDFSTLSCMLVKITLCVYVTHQ